MKRRTLIASLAICLIVLWQCWPKPAPPEVRVVHHTYLPMVCTGPSVALGGVGLSGPCSAVAILNLDWYYNWGWRPCKTNDPLYVAMIWGRGAMRYVPEAIAIARAGSGWLLGFNEPDQLAQANISPREAAELQHRIEAQAEGVKLVSPAPSQDDPGWLWRMVDEYQQKYGHKPRFDAIAAHYYAHSGEPDDVKQYLLKIRRESLEHGYDVPIWLTEFAGLCTQPDPRGGHRRIMREVIPWMKQQPWMGRYAWFASRLPDEVTADMEPCSLTDPQTFQLTSLGELYKSIGKEE